MANMSYCAFHNTGLAIQQILSMMEEAETIKDMNFGSDELRAFKQMTKQAEQLCDEIERISENSAE